MDYKLIYSSESNVILHNDEIVFKTQRKESFLNVTIKIYDKTGEVVLIYKFSDFLLKNVKFLCQNLPDKSIVRLGFKYFSIMVDNEIFRIKRLSLIKSKYELLKGQEKIADIKLEDPFFKAFYSIKFKTKDSKTQYFGLILVLLYFTNVGNNNI